MEVPPPFIGIHPDILLHLIGNTQHHQKIYRKCSHLLIVPMLNLSVCSVNVFLLTKFGTLTACGNVLFLVEPIHIRKKSSVLFISTWYHFVHTTPSRSSRRRASPTTVGHLPTPRILMRIASACAGNRAVIAGPWPFQDTDAECRLVHRPITVW